MKAQKKIEEFKLQEKTINYDGGQMKGRNISMRNRQRKRKGFWWRKNKNLVTLTPPPLHLKKVLINQQYQVLTTKTYFNSWIRKQDPIICNDTNRISEHFSKPCDQCFTIVCLEFRKLWSINNPSNHLKSESETFTKNYAHFFQARGTEQSTVIVSAKKGLWLFLLISYLITVYIIDVGFCKYQRCNKWC